MTRLRELQHEFQDYILHGLASVAEKMEGGGTADPHRRLRIYHDGYRLRLAEALATDYEALRALLGADDFNVVCARYVQNMPSVHRNVRWYGQGLPAFLQETEPWAQRPELYELALFEWTLTLAFDARDAPVVRFDELAQTPAETWPELRFVLHPSLHAITLSTNAPAQRKAADEGRPPPQPVISSQPTPWIVWRKALSVCFRSLEEPEHSALETIRDGADFTRLCEGLCRWYAQEQAASQAAQLLRRWVDDELITELGAAR